MSVSVPPSRRTLELIDSRTGLFFLFSFGVALNSLRFVFTNSTTVDDLTQKSRITHFAVRVSNAPTDSDVLLPFATITYPLRSPSDVTTMNHDVPSRTFAILETPAGSNPYDLSSKICNFKCVMGRRWYDWILPLKHSPCYERRMRCMAEESGSQRSNLYKLGPLLEQVKTDSGLSSSQRKTTREPQTTSRRGGRRHHDRDLPSDRKRDKQNSTTEHDSKHRHSYRKRRPRDRASNVP